MTHGRFQRFLARSILAAAVFLLPLAATGDDTKLNVNTATVEQLTQLSGVGDVIAKAIVAHREKNGPFKNLNELVAVRGIGEKSLARFKNQITVGDRGDAQPKVKPGS